MINSITNSIINRVNRYF